LRPRCAGERTTIKISSKDFRVREGDDVDLGKWPTIVDPVYKSKEQYQELLTDHVTRLSSRQQLLYASNHYAILLVFQAMDAAGKDGSIRHVMSGVNPQGCQVFSFKHPSAAELQHDFLWRTTRDLPERGRIGIFNRSYYEEVLIVRVHRDILLSEGLPDAPDDDKILWRDRYRSISNLERISTPTALASSNSSFISRRRSSASASSPASTSRKRTGNSAPPTSKNANSGSIM
jgi:polyphosphate kinase 2 (PPK2 family)